MLRQISVLVKLELCNLWGRNVRKHIKDSREKKKSMALTVAFCLVFAVLMGYVGGLCYGLIYLGAAQVVPAYLIFIASILTLAFGIFKAGSMLFKRQGYDMLAAMPLSKEVIVISRFLRLYVENLLVVLLVMVPGMTVVGVMERPAAGFYGVGVLAILVTPLLPVAISAGIGALITGIASRMKHKALVEAGLSVCLVVGMLLLSSKLSGAEDNLTMEMLKNMADMMTELIGKMYPPAVWLGTAMVQGQLAEPLLFGLGALVILGMVIVVVSANFHKICHRLFATSAKHDYQAEQLQQGSVRKALVVREAKRYFSSGAYVTNTIIGPIMAVALSISLFFMDVEAMAGTLPVHMNVRAAIPFVIGAVFSMMTTTSVSISMEGKTAWILQSLPLSRKQILDGKILFQLCLYAPFYVVAVLVCIIALQPTAMEVLGLIFVPAVICLFAAVFGITVNLWLPRLNWESEVSVVKQSAAAAIGGIGGALGVVVCAMVVLLLPVKYGALASVAICGVMLVITAVLYVKNNKE